MVPRRIVLLGPPGAGKGTHGARLSEIWGVPHIATGDMLRRIIESDDGDLARQLRVINKGNLIPDELMNALLFGELDKAAGGWILDGYPRTLAQAHVLDAYLVDKGLMLDAALALDVTEETVLDRLSARLTCPNCGASYHLRNEPPQVTGICDRCGHSLVVREDDRPDRVRVRLRLYHERSEPVLCFYADSGRLKRVPADLGEEATLAKILQVFAD